MKKIIFTLMLSAGILSLAACSSGESDSDVVVESSAGDITKEAFYEELKDRYGEEILKEMITVVILEDKYEVEEKSIDNELKKIKDELGDGYEDALKQQGITEDKLRKDIKKSLLQEAALTEDLDVKEEEIKEQYERMKTEIEAQHILVADEETANTVKKKLDEGGDFAELAKEFSTDPSAADAGKLGYFTVGAMVPEFEEAAYSLEVDTISDPVQSQHGFHVIKVTDKREVEEDIGSMEENKEEIRRNLLNKKIDPEKAMEKMSNLLTDTKIDVKIEQFKDIFKEQQAPSPQAKPE